MEYRVIPKSGEKVSTIGIGGTSMHEISIAEFRHMVDYALDQGVNRFRRFCPVM